MCEDYFNSINKLTGELIISRISGERVEFKKENLPYSRGGYFIYKKTKEGIQDTPSYIGCAYKKVNENEGSKNRSISLRCGQNLNPKDTGGTFRDRVMREELNLEPYEYIEGKKGKIICENTKKGRAYISENYYLKFIVVDDNISENEVLLIERACINYYNPIYNRG